MTVHWNVLDHQTSSKLRPERSFSYSSVYKKEGKMKERHTVPAQKSNISKKIIVGESLTFSFLKIIRRLLLFARLSYYFTPVLGSQSLPPSSRLPFWPPGFILPPIIENLLIYVFPYGFFGGGVSSDITLQHQQVARNNIKQPSSLAWIYLFNDWGSFNWLSSVWQTSWVYGVEWAHLRCCASSSCRI